MAQTNKRLDQLEKTLGVNTGEMGIEIIEIWGLPSLGQTRYLMESWDLRTSEVVKYDQEGNKTIERFREEDPAEG